MCPSPRGAGGDVEAGEVEAKYAPEYAASVDPFSAWRTRERERGRASMAAPDRIMFAAGQMIATNKCAFCGDLCRLLITKFKFNS